MPENQSPELEQTKMTSPIVEAAPVAQEPKVAATVQDIKVDTVKAEETSSTDEEKIPLEEKFFAPPTPAQNTFGRRVTQEEIVHREKVANFFEKFLWLVAVIVVMIILWASWPKIEAFLDLLTEPSAAEQISTPQVMETTSQVVQPILSGSLYRSTEDFGYLRTTAFTEINYYMAGKFASGKYADAERIIAVAQRNNGEVMNFTFVRTAVGEIFLVGGKPNPQQWLKTLQSFYLFDEINQDAQTIRLVDEIETDHPQTLPVSKAMVLYKQNLLTQVGPYPGEAETAKLNSNLDFQEYHNLSLLQAQNYPGVKIYDKVYNRDELLNQVRTNLVPNEEAVLDTYINSGTKFVVLDSVGVPVVYELVFTDRYQNYQQDALTKELFALDLYQKELAKYAASDNYLAYRKHVEETQAVQLPEDGPAAPVVGQNLPGFSYAVTDFEFNSDIATVFTDFGPALLSSCTSQKDTKVIQNLTTDDLEPVGKIFVPQATLYRLIDENHPLLQLAYNAKFVNTGLDETEIVAENQDLIVPMKPYTKSELSRIRNGRLKVTLPTLAEYAQQMPLLFTIDPWGRILMIQESAIVSDPACLTEQDVV
ncbi:MAG: hypothetical protein Q4G02_02640 [bacterium]|nr:hypothetical protein [bacterium]